MIGRLLLVVCVLVLPAGCEPFASTDSLSDEYLERLARVLEVDSPDRVAPPSASALPRRRERVLAMPELQMGMLDFLSLYGCELQYVVGEKASIMGRVIQPINRLRYEVRFIQAGEDCLPEIEDEELSETLRAAIDSKRQSLPLAVWNATWGTEEVETLLTLSKGDYPVGAGPAAVSDLSLDLDQLNRITAQLNQQRLDVPLQSLGKIQQRWQAEFRGGQLINSARLLIGTLRSGTAIIETRLDDRPLCLNGQRNNQSDIVHSFFLKVYIGQIQPYMSDVSRARQMLIEPLAELAAQQSGVMPETFRSWYQRHLASRGENSLWQQLDEAMARHTRAWQQLLGQCGLRPGA